MIMVFLKKITSLFRLLWSKKTIANVRPFSKFEHFLDGFDSDNEMYDDVATTVNLCDEALRIAKQRIVLVGKNAKIDDKILELECYSKLTDEEAARLKKLLEAFTSLTEERNMLRYQLMDFDKNVNKLTDLEEDAASAIPKIQEAEKYVRILKHDVGHLQGEKADLVYERELIESGLDFIKKFSTAMVILFVLVALYLGYSYILREAEIFIPTTVLVLLAIIVISFLTVFKRKLNFELKVNVKKQQRAVELINKKNVVFAYYTNFLNYEYNKYKVRNLQMLKSSLKEYGNYKHVASRIDSIRNIIFETESEIESFLREKNINQLKFSIEQFVYMVNVDDKIEFYKELMEKKRAIEKNLTELDKKHGQIWDILVEINNRDSSLDKVIDSIIQSYFLEVNRVLLPENMSLHAEDDEEAEESADGEMKNAVLAADY